MPAPSIVQTLPSVAEATATNSLQSAAFTSPVTAGNAIIVCLSKSVHVGTSWTVTDTAGNTYNFDNSHGTISTEVFNYVARNVIGGSNLKITVTVTGNALNLTFTAFEVANLPPLDQTNSATNTATFTHSTGAINTLYPNELVVIAIAPVNQAAQTITTPSGFTSQGKEQGNTFQELDGATQIFAGIQTGLNPAWTTNVSTTSAAIITTYGAPVSSSSSSGSSASSLSSASSSSSLSSKTSSLSSGLSLPGSSQLPSSPTVSSALSSMVSSASSAISSSSSSSLSSSSSPSQPGSPSIASSLRASSAGSSLPSSLSPYSSLSSLLSTVLSSQSPISPSQVSPSQISVSLISPSKVSPIPGCPSFIGSTNASGASFFTLLANPGTLAGDILITCLTYDLTVGSRPTPPIGWQFIQATTNASYETSSWYKVATANEPAGYLWNSNGTGVGTLTTWRGAGGPTPVSSTTGLTASGLTLGNNSFGLLGFFGENAISGIGAPPGMTDLGFTSNNTATPVAQDVSYQIVQGPANTGGRTATGGSGTIFAQLLAVPCMISSASSFSFSSSSQSPSSLRASPSSSPFVIKASSSSSSSGISLASSSSAVSSPGLSKASSLAASSQISSVIPSSSIGSSAASSPLASLVILSSSSPSSPTSSKASSTASSLASSRVSSGGSSPPSSKASSAVSSPRASLVSSPSSLLSSPRASSPSSRFSSPFSSPARSSAKSSLASSLSLSLFSPSSVTISPTISPSPALASSLTFSSSASSASAIVLIGRIILDIVDFDPIIVDRQNFP